ncbi:hypothetical protein Sliba_06440 [Streptomyces nigrescens]|uniref:Uncharacterized protein n=1 Tax=Streptomyces nigrescens TaxID=1920 RepID=A0A640TCI9_STRNI|nr:hypothetical protein Sliba_06440 [Streptomyces libani subsp. libani]GGV86125.1 hypothetical protein GCM10010500_03880 [Streptomyces libani subsp. libani]
MPSVVVRVPMRWSVLCCRSPAYGMRAAGAGPGRGWLGRRAGLSVSVRRRKSVPGEAGEWGRPTIRVAPGRAVHPGGAGAAGALWTGPGPCPSVNSRLCTTVRARSPLREAEDVL